MERPHHASHLSHGLLLLVALFAWSCGGAPPGGAAALTAPPSLPSPASSSSSSAAPTEPPTKGADPASPEAAASPSSSPPKNPSLQQRIVEVPCLRNDAASGWRVDRLRRSGTYLVQFDQAGNQFLYPSSEPLDGEEIVLQICNVSSWKRYRLVFGSRTIGDDSTASTSVGYAPREIDAALRRATALFASDEHCDAQPDATAGATTPTPAGAPPTTTAPGSRAAQCKTLREQVSGLVEVAKRVIARRDGLAEVLTKCSAMQAHNNLPVYPTGTSSPANTAEPPTQSTVVLPGGNACVSDFSCTFPISCTRQSFSFENQINRDLEAAGVGARIVWIDDAWYLIDRGADPNAPVAARAASLDTTPGKEALPSVLLAYLNVRAELITAIQAATDGLARLEALSLNIASDLSRRQLSFRLGRFPGNRLVVGTLEEHTAAITYADDKKRLNYKTTTVSHQLSLGVRNVSYVQFDLGVAYSWMDAPKYGTRPAASGSADTLITQEDDGRDLSPVVFASFLWCAQPLDKPWIARTCRDGSQNAWWALPRIAIGLPLNSSLGRGSAYLGLSLPYIPYVSLIGGVHGRRVEDLADGYSVGQPSPTGSDIRRSSHLRFAPFLTVGVTEEIFYLLTPKVEAAK